MKKQTPLHIILTLCFIILISAYYIVNVSHVNMEAIRVLGVMCIMGLIYILYSWYKCGGTFLNGYVVFITAFFSFNLGQSMLEVFDYVSEMQNLLTSYNVIGVSVDYYFRATYIGLFFILFMHIGALMALSGRRITHYSNDLELSSYAIRGKFLAIRKISLYILFFSFPFWFYMTSRILAFTAVYGYGGALYGEVISKLPGYVRLFGDYYEPSLLCLYFSSEYLKKGRNAALAAIIITLILPPLMIGGRSEAVIAIAMTLIIYSLFHKIQVRKVCLMVLGGYLLMIGLFVVKKTRNYGNAGIKQYTEAIFDKESSPVSEILSEMGHSMYPLAETMSIVPADEGYRYGATYFWAFTSLIPNLGFWEKHPAQLYGNLGNWLMKKRNLGFGPGYSITAEAYINFGYLGFMFFLVFGYYLAKYCRYINSKDVLIRPFFVIATLVFLWFSIKTVRNSFVGMVRALFYFSILFYCLFRYYYNKHFRRHEIA